MLQIPMIYLNLSFRLSLVHEIDIVNNTVNSYFTKAFHFLFLWIKFANISTKLLNKNNFLDEY